MSWNYRVIRRYRERGDNHDLEALLADSWLEITEVYYKSDGSYDGFVYGLLAPYAGGAEGDTEVEAIEDIRHTLEYMMEALSKPIVDEKDVTWRKTCSLRPQESLSE